jgi:putative ABC transport system permease protein
MYLETMRIPLLSGRMFTEFDNARSQLVAIVNKNMARTFWPNENPIGKRFSIKGPTGPFI